MFTYELSEASTSTAHNLQVLEDERCSLKELNLSNNDITFAIHTVGSSSSLLLSSLELSDTKVYAP